MRKLSKNGIWGICQRIKFYIIQSAENHRVSFAKARKVVGIP